MNDDREYGDDLDVANGSDQGYGKIEIVARRTVRFILSNAEAQNTIITRDRITKAIREFAREYNSGNMQFAAVYKAVNEILDSVYGYELRGIAPKSKLVGDVSTKKDEPLVEMDDLQLGSKASHFIILNKLPYLQNFSEYKQQQSIRTYSDLVINGEYVGDDMDLESMNTLENKMSVDEDLTLRGIVSVVLCVILFSKNNILHQELLTYLTSFGIPTDGTEIPILKYSIDDLLKNLEKKEYIASLEEKSDNEGSVIFYRIGRRAKHEFDMESLTKLVKEIMDLSEEQSKSLKDDIRKTIGDAYT